MISLLALSPILLLLGTAAVTSPHPFPPRVRPFVESTAIVFAAILVVLNARTFQTPLSPFSPAPTSSELDLLFVFGAGPVSFCLLACFALLARLTLGNMTADAPLGAGPLVTLAGVIVFFLAGNWSTLAAAWLLADLGFLIWRADFSLGAKRSLTQAMAAFIVSQIAAVGFLAAGTLAAAAGSTLRFDEATLEGLPAALVVLAAWVRSGLYPFHVQGAHEWTVPRADRMRGFGFPSLLGVFLLVRALSMIHGDISYANWLTAAALFAMGATALVVLREAEAGKNAIWPGLAAAAPILMLPFAAPDAARAPLAILWAWSFFCFAAAASGASLLLAQTRRQPVVQLLSGAALACAAGAPLTPGFWGRVGLYAGAMASGQFLMVVAVATSTTLALIPLCRSFLASRLVETRGPTPIEYSGSALLMAPIIASGVAPFVLLSFFGRSVEDAGAFAYDAIFHPSSVQSLLIELAATILPIAVSFVIAQRWNAVRIRIRRGAGFLAAVLELTWLGNALGRLADGLSVTLRQITALVEQHPIGWIVFVAIWVALWILNTRVGK